MAIDLKTLTNRLIRSGFPRRGASGAAQAILDAVGTSSGGGGGTGTPVRTSTFSTFTLPRNTSTGQLGSLSFDTVVHRDATGAEVAAWGGAPYTTDDLILTPADGGQGFYEVAVDFSLGLPVADLFLGLAIRLGRDAFDPTYRQFAAVKPASGNGGVSGGFVRPCVWIDADDGFRLQSIIVGDPLTSTRDFFTNSGQTTSLVSVTLRKLT